MNAEQILSAIRELSYSQGFYGRLLRDMSDEFLDEMVAQNFTSTLDMVLWLEC